LREGKFTIKLPEERALKAGIYKLKVELVKDGITYTQEQEFQWGLVSLNTRKSIYTPGEPAEFIIVVLDKYGHPVCNADISMTVTNPNNEKTTYSTGKGTITASSECGIYNANYLTEVEGNHTIDLTAQTLEKFDQNASAVDNVAVNFSTYFLVQQDYEFDIIRTAQSKIDPTKQDWFDVKIDIESFTDAESVKIKEFVPAEFDVVTDAATVLLEDDTKTITWNLYLIDNKTFVTYSYSIPHVWPYLYSSGPAEIAYGGGVFKEARPWYVAVDPETNLTVTSCDVNDAYDCNCYNAISADGGTSYGLPKDSHIDAPFQTLSGVRSVNSATLYYDSWANLKGSGHWEIHVKDARDGNTICSDTNAPEDGSETRNSVDCSSITPAQLGNGVWLYIINLDAGTSQDVNLDYVYLYVDCLYTPHITLNQPENASFVTTSWTLLNATVTDADNDNMTVCFYANNNSNGLNDSEGLVYIRENVANGTTLI